MVHVDDDTGDGVTADPEVTETTLTPADEYFVMACDGLWDVVSNEEAVAMIKVGGGGEWGAVATKSDEKSTSLRQSCVYVKYVKRIARTQNRKNAVHICCDFSLPPFDSTHSPRGFLSFNSLLCCFSREVHRAPLR